MSAHRAGARLVTRDAGEAGPPGGEPSSRVLACAPGDTEFEQLSGLILAFPATAERLLTPRRVPDPVLLLTLLAETALRLDVPRHALVLARRAVNEAAGGEQTPAARLLAAAVVLADAMALEGAPDTVESCADAFALAGRLDDPAWAMIAAGLQAVALYQQRGRQQARHLFPQLADHCDSGVSAALTRAIDTLDVGCAHRSKPHRPPANRPIITAGGLVEQALTESFWADRLLRWPGCHDCAPAAGRPA